MKKNGKIKMVKVNINSLIQQGSKIKINNINFDQINFENLLIDTTNESDFLQHIEKQAAGIAYYGMLFKQAQQQLNNLQKQRNDYYMQKSQLSQLSLAKMGSTKPTKWQIDALTQQNYKKALQKFDQQINQLTQQVDILQQYYQGWKQKGFVLNNMVSLISSGLMKLNNQ